VAKDSLGNTVTASLQVTNIDKIVPEISALYSENASQAVMFLTATDNNSGISSLVTTGNHDSNTTTVNNGAIQYHMYVSTDGTTTVTAKDRAGNTTTKTHKIKFLFTYNDQKTATTGGWISNYHKDQFGDIVDVTYYSEKGGLVIDAKPTTLDVGRLGSWYTRKAIDLSGYDKLRCDAWFDKNSTGYIWLGLSGDFKATADINVAKAQNDYDGSNGYWVRMDTDISSINTTKQPIIGTQGDKGNYVKTYLAIMYMYSFK